MKVLIHVTRRTEYASIVEMTPETFEKFDIELNACGKRAAAAEAELNNMIDVDDWQDDSLVSLDAFEESKEEVDA